MSEYWYSLDDDRNVIGPYAIEELVKRRRKTADDLWWRVAREAVGECEVSTVFLQLDHQYGYGPPLVFETLVFGGPFDGEMDRCSTWAEAEEMHRRMVERVRAAAIEQEGRS